MKATLHKVDWLDQGETMRFISKQEIELPTKDRLKFMQDLVGGLIDIYHHEGRDWVLNDEGLLIGLPINPWSEFHGFEIAGNIIECHGILD